MLPTVDISGTVILVYDILMAGIEKETDFSIRHNVYFFLQICSSIPTVLFRHFFHLETASLKTLRLVCDIFRPTFKFKLNFNL